MPNQRKITWFQFYNRLVSCKQFLYMELGFEAKLLWPWASSITWNNCNWQHLLKLKSERSHKSYIKWIIPSMLFLIQVIVLKSLLEKNKYLPINSTHIYANCPVKQHKSLLMGIYKFTSVGKQIRLSYKGNINHFRLYQMDGQLQLSHE